MPETKPRPNNQNPSERIASKPHHPPTPSSMVEEDASHLYQEYPLMKSLSINRSSIEE